MATYDDSLTEDELALTKAQVDRERALQRLVRETPGVKPHQNTPLVTVEECNWMADAACLGMDPELFFPGQGESTARARAVCRECPVVDTCRDWAVENLRGHKDQGIWGNTSVRERRAIRRQRRLGVEVA